MMHDIPDFELIIICFSYTLIAASFWPLVGLPSKAGRSALYLVLIFINCALSGYAPRLFDQWWPDWLTGATHIMLCFASVSYVVTAQHQHLIKIIEREINGD